MKITNIKIRKLYTDMRLKAHISITIDDCLAVHDIKIIEGPERVFVAMPSKKDANGIFRDVVHPISAELRKTMETQILQSYYDYLENIQI